MFSIRRWFSIGLLALLAVPQPSVGEAADKENVGKQSSDTSKAASTQPLPSAFLGLLVEDLPPAFASQLPAIVSREQGVLVVDVTPDSPASKSGLKPHDILLSYDDQKLFAAEQLIKLVHADKPGRKVTLEVVRAGKLQSDQVTLGERSGDSHVAAPSATQVPRRFPWMPWRQRSTPAPERPGWSSFDSMTLKKLDENRFHASIRHTDKAGKLQKHEFEGTVEEIRKQIGADKDMLPDERSHLLRGLDLETRGVPIWIIPERDLLFDF